MIGRLAFAATTLWFCLVLVLSAPLHWQEPDFWTGLIGAAAVGWFVAWRARRRRG